MAQPPEMQQNDTIEPRYAWVFALLTCVAGTMLLAYPALSGQFLVNILSDQYIAGYSFREFGAQVLRATGGFALWNPYLFGGMPYVGAMHGDIFYPTAFMRMVMPTDVAMTWGMILHYMLGGFATYVFLRALGLRFFGALVGAVAYMLSGWNASYVTPGHDGKIFVGAMLPLAMLCILRGIRDGKNWVWGALAAVVGLGMLSPHPQLMQYLLMGSGVFALYVAFGMARTRRHDRSPSDGSPLHSARERSDSRSARFSISPSWNTHRIHRVQVAGTTTSQRRFHFLRLS